MTILQTRRNAMLTMVSVAAAGVCFYVDRWVDEDHDR
jgi:hypothetical protein